MITLIAFFRLIAMESNYETKKEGTTMNPLTQFKKIRILPLLIAPALVIIAALTAAPAPCNPPRAGLSAKCRHWYLSGWIAQLDVRRVPEARVGP